MTGGIKDIHREAIIAEIAANDRVERAVLFGSRATGTNTITSDVDIALFGNRLTRTDQVRLAAALEEIPMAQTVDLVLYDSIRNKELESHIRRHGIEWYARPAVTDNGHAICSPDRTEFVPLNSECSEIDIPAEELKIIQELLEQHLPDTDAWIYDLRGKHASISEADFSLVVFSSPSQKQAISDLREALNENELSFFMNMIDWNNLSEESQNGIHEGHNLSKLILVSGKCYSIEGNGAKYCWTTIGECAMLARDTVIPSDVDTTLPYVGLEHIGKGTLSLINYGTAKDIISNKLQFQRGDILFGKLRPYFRKIIRAKFDGICSTDIWVVRSSGKVVAGYLYYLLASQKFVDIATQGAVGTRMPRAKWDYVRRFRLLIPPPPKQNAIAHILGTIDDKIELNRRMSKTLEAMSRALFKSWFIDFDPVRAKMEGRNTGLPKHIADLFPDRLVDSELGEIPEGWEVKQLKECMNLTMGQSPPSITYNDRGEGLPFFQGSSRFGFRYARKQRFCSAPARIALSDDTLISVRAPVGDINMAWERCCIGRGLAALRHKSGSHSFTYYSAWALQGQLKEYEHTGTVFGAINKGQFETLMIIEPSAEVLVAFDTMFASFDQRIRSSTSESHNLEVLRDVLLPKLI